MITTAEARARWIAGIERHVLLSQEERNAIGHVQINVRSYGPHSDIIRDGDQPTNCCIVLKGLCWRYKINLAGRRQILALHQAGDMPDLQSLHIRRMDHSIATVTRSEVGLVSHEQIESLTARYPRITEAFWRATLLEMAIFREWMVSLGTRTAMQRAGHLFCEMYLLAQASGRTIGPTYVLPLTQRELSDVLGMSVVHVNRILRDLREAGWVSIERQTIAITGLEGLQRFVGFDPTYLDACLQADGATPAEVNLS